MTASRTIRTHARFVRLGPDPRQARLVTCSSTAATRTTR